MTLTSQVDNCVSVRSIFELERNLSAPLYQRRYAWNRKNVGEFWDDIKSVEDGESDALFLGAIILKHEGPSNPSGGALEQFLVLDGQQRIATLFLTLLAIAVEWQEHGHTDRATAIAENLLMSVKTNTRGKARFSPTIPDMREFVSLCRKLKVDWALQPVAEAKAGRMTAAFERAQKEVRTRCLSDGAFVVDALEDLEQTIVDKVELATINIAERHQPNEVFDRLNRKGQALTVGDLVKNEVFRRIPDAPITAGRLYEEKWRPFEDSFSEKKQLDNYYYPFTLTVEDSATIAGSFKILSDHWDSLIRDDDRAEDIAELIIEDLSRFVPEYNALSTGTSYSAASKDIPVLVSRLFRMPAPRSTYAYLIQLLHAQRTGTLRASAVANCLKIVESFLVRRAFSGLEPTGLHAVFKSLWARNGGNPASLVANLQTRTITFPEDQQVISDISTREFYGRRIDKYVLAEFEIDTHKKNPFSPEQLSNITVDHLAPQSLKGSWIDHFPKETEERQRLLGLLGNLVPLSQSENSTKGAASWDEARTLLRNETIYRSARDVLDKYKSWGPSQIKERTEEMAHWAVRRWPRPGKKQ